MRLYLAHPFELRREIRVTELSIEKEVDIELVNPFYDTDGRMDVDKIDRGELSRDSVELDYVNIVEKDLALIDTCDGIVAYIEKGQYSIGTICEVWDTVGMAKLPVYIVSPNCYNHPWIRYAVTISDGEIFRNWDEFKSYLWKRFYICKTDGEL